MQKDMQDQLQAQLQEKLAKIQQDMRDQMLESQRSLMSQLTQLMAGGHDKGNIPMVNSEDDHEDPAYPPSFTPTNTQAQPDVYPQRGSGFNSGDNATNPVVLDLDEMAEIEKSRVELPKQLEDRYRWLEEKLRAIENADYHYGVDAKDLSLVPDLVLSPKFKTPKFEKYTGTSCPEAHITVFYRRMTGFVNNDQLLIHFFQYSLIGSASKCYNQLSRAKIHS
ncbi:uncharacterized protein [Gossypium hirsutum]|uniref:Intersectin-1-like n=1 Tax=Gossypium hirsutum TaxID=3635 RepID=A0A1U8N056_GOSHI|nr:uncharacterized protein LOC107942077 [Gossypium hirsutum]